MQRGQQTLEEAVRTLQAREEIKELCARYFWGAARGDTDGMADCFTQDGVFDALAAGAPYRPQGMQQLREYFALVIGSKPSPIPMGHDHIIAIDGDNAHGTIVFDSRTGGKLAGGFTGFYQDRYRRENGRWLFAERVFDTYAVFPAQPGVEIKLPGST